MENYTQDLGNAIFISWDNLDKMLMHWAEKYFGNYDVEAKGVRDEGSFFVELTLKASDYEKFVELFKEYDKDGLYEPIDEFTADGTSILGETMSRLLINDIVYHIYEDAVALYEGVLFIEKRYNA